MTTGDNSPTDMAVGDRTIAKSLTREALYALVWSEPMLKVAARYGVSSSYMARVCALLNVPRPERGYWAKLAVGKATAVPALPDARPGDELTWSRDGHVSVPRPLPRPPDLVPKDNPKRAVSTADQHPLTKGVKALFESGRLSYDVGYLKPAKKLLIDLAVSKTGLDKALSFANQLFSSLEANGHRVVIAPHGEYFRRAEVDVHEVPQRNLGYSNLWSPARCTVVYIGTVAIGLTIIEMSEEVEVRYVNGKYVREADYVAPKRGRYGMDHTWTSKKEFPTGRLCLQAYSPDPRAEWAHHWREAKDRDLKSRISDIVKDLEHAVVDVARLIEEGQRKAELERQRWEAQHEQWRREEAERQAAKAVKESKEDLLQIIDRWAQTNRIEQFFADVERRAAGLSDDEKSRMHERLKRARDFIGGSDALHLMMRWRLPNERYPTG